MLMSLLVRYVLTFFPYCFLVNVDVAANSDSGFPAHTVKQTLTPGGDLILGDNWSPYDLQVYGKYYESISAAQLQPQESKRLYVNGALVDFEPNDNIYESSVIGVPDIDKVVMAPSRTVTTKLYDSTGTAETGEVSRTETYAPSNGSNKRDAVAAGLASNLRDEN